MTTKLIPTEDQEHQALAQYLWAKGYRFHHSPNATGSSAEARRRAVRMKRMGTSPGFPDLLVFAHGHRIAIELKRQKGGRATPQQIEWLDTLSNYGFSVKVARGAKEAIDFIEEVANNK